MPSLSSGDQKFRAFDPFREELPRIMNQLLREQAASWPRLREGVESLKSVRTRNVPCEGFSVNLQFNPGRMISTAAQVDAQSIRERPCFLCPSNLPPEQNGVLYGDSTIILCNPAPIFNGHYTISHLEHLPQNLESSLRLFLDLAKDLSPKFSLFYNGPKCGASAPDHLHFQSAPMRAIPVEIDAKDASRRDLKGERSGVQVLTLKRYGREVIVIESKKRDELSGIYLMLMNSLRRHSGISDEPMVNVIGSYEEGAWRLIVFPRSKHRPQAYFHGGDKKVLVSPAAVDIGGLIITPIEKDFQTLDGPAVEGIFREVSMPPAFIERVLEPLVGATA